MGASVHRSLNADAEPSPAADEPATETPVAAPAVAAVARDDVIDLPLTNRCGGDRPRASLADQPQQNLVF